MNKVEHAICRIRERLPQQDNFVTLGVGCVVKHEALAASLGWKCPNLLVTSVDVLSPQQLSSDRTFTAEFLVFEKKGLEVFELKPAAEFCITISGRNLNEQDGSHPNEQLTVLSVEPLDKRGFLKRMVKKSSLQTTRPIDCFDFHNYDNEIDDGLFCNVIREFGSIGQEFESRTYKFKFSKSRNVYLLEDFLHRDIELEEQSFPSDQILAGGVVFSKQGLYLGCLAFYAGQIVPSFIPDTYFQLQEEEAPKEQQGGNEAEGIDADSRKDDEIDENENRELAEENIKEQAYSKETLCEDETPSVHPSIDQLEMHRNDEVGSSDDKEVIEIENMENENVENTSQEEIQEPDKNSEATELGYFKSRRDSTELEFVVSVENAENEESENVNEKAPGSISEMEDNSVKNETKVDDTSEQNDNQEKISSEMEDKEADEEITQNETKPDSEDTNEQEQTNVGQDTLMDNMLHKENDISILQTDHVEDNVVNERNDVTMETDTEIKNEEESVLDNTTEKSVEVEETEKNPVNNDCPGIDIAGTDVNTDMERSELNQQTEVESEDQRTTSDIPTSMQEDIPVDNKLTEEISPEDDETSENKEVEVEVEILSPETTNTDETQGPNLREENTLDKNQVSSEDSHTDEISELSSSNLEIHQQSEDRELSSHQDEILVNQEEIMSVDGEKQAETQNEVKRDVIELDKPVKPDVIELNKPVKPEEAGEPLEPDDLLTIKITNNPKALDDLAILLDTEHQHGGVSSWYDLAELLAIPKEAYNHCISFSKPSPTEDLLVFLSSTKPQFSIGDLKDSLRSISRPDVVHIVDRYIARAVISDGTVIQGVIEREDIDLLGELALKLDRGHHSNWKVLARQLEVPSRIFRNFGSHQRQNSALLMLKYLPIFDPDLTVDSLKDSCRTVGLDDLVKFLDASGVPGDDAIMDILEDTDFIGEITDILNEEDENGPNWKRLGRELKIPEEKFSIFEPSSMNSPTKMLLQSIAKCEPDITVDELILALVAMKRHDIIEMLGKHFRNSDIRSILEENNCLPPQPEDSIKEEEEEESTA